MPYRATEFAAGEVYHVFNRGAGRNPIFFGPDNYAHCLRLMKRYRGPFDVAVIAYCLMPNHYHLMLRQEREGDGVSRFINTLFNAYVQAVNRQQGRSGTLFEGRFRHVRVDRDGYAMHLARYIHRNPLAAGLVARVEDWPWSNYLEWTGRREGALKDEAFMRRFFNSGDEYAAFVEAAQDETPLRPWLLD